MKQTLIVLLCIAIITGCSKDDDPGASKFQHKGEKWNISVLNYNIVDMGLSNPMEWVKIGTANNAGAFYFDGSEGSYEIVVDGERKEDYFSFKKDGSSITIVQVDQSISTSKISQEVMTFSGDISDNNMSLSGTIVKQGMTNEYVFTGDFVLTRE